MNQRGGPTRKILDEATKEFYLNGGFSFLSPNRDEHEVRLDLCMHKGVVIKTASLKFGLGSYLVAGGSVIWQDDCM